MLLVFEKMKWRRVCFRSELKCGIGVIKVEKIKVRLSSKRDLSIVHEHLGNTPDCVSGKDWSIEVEMGVCVRRGSNVGQIRMGDKYGVGGWGEFGEVLQVLRVKRRGPAPVEKDVEVIDSQKSRKGMLVGVIAIDRCNLDSDTQFDKR